MTTRNRKEGKHNMTEKLKVEGILSLGYGVIPKLVMKDKNISIEAKSIYAYLCSYAGNGETAFPSVSLICEDLGISENRLYKHRKQLVEAGYIKIERERKEVGWSNNIYTIAHTVYLQNEGIQTVHRQNEGIQNEGIGNKGIQNEGTNNNSSNNNSFNNNNNNTSRSSDEEIAKISDFYQKNIGMLAPNTAEHLIDSYKTFGYDMVIHALTLTVDRHANYGYAKSILQRWLKNNIKTMDDVKAEEVAFKNRKQKVTNFKKNSNYEEIIPSWMTDKEKQEVIEEPEVSSESEETLRERLSALIGE